MPGGNKTLKLGEEVVGGKPHDAPKLLSGVRRPFATFPRCVALATSAAPGLNGQGVPNIRVNPSCWYRQV